MTGLVRDCRGHHASHLAPVSYPLKGIDRALSDELKASIPSKCLTIYSKFLCIFI